MSTKIKILLIFASTWACQLAGKAQSLNLKDAINIALERSYNIRLAKNELQASAISNTYGMAGGLPIVNANATDNEQITDLTQGFSDANRNVKRSGATANNLNASVTASLLLSNGFRVVATKRQLEELQKISEQDLNARIQNIMASVMFVYYDIVRQQSYMKTIDRSMDVAQQRLDIIRSRQNVGLANNADLFQAQLDLNTLVQSKESQQLVVDQAKTQMLNLLSLRPDSTVTISDTIIPDQSVTLASVMDALGSNPNIQVAEHVIKENQWIEKQTASQRYPSLRVNAGYNYARSQNAAGFILLNKSYGPTVGLTLAVPIYNGGIYRRQQQVAQINTANAMLMKDSLMKAYTTTIVRTWQSYSSSLRQLQTAEKNYQLSNQLLDLVMQRFQLRESTIVDVRQAQQSFEAVAYELTNLAFAAKTAEIELKLVAARLQF